MRELRRAHKNNLETLRGRDNLVSVYMYEKMILKDIDCEDVDWIHVAQDKD
jgi:hypothetical protein